MPVEDGVLFVAALRDHLLASAPAGSPSGPVTGSSAAAVTGKGKKRRAAKMAVPEPGSPVRLSLGHQRQCCRHRCVLGLSAGW